MINMLNWALNGNPLIKWMNGSKLFCGLLSGLVAWTYFNHPDMLEPIMKALSLAGFILVPIGAAGKVVKVVAKDQNSGGFVP